MKQPTAQELQDAKQELVNEAANKILKAVGNEIVVDEVVTAPYDPRFPNTNQARHCFVRFNEFHKCVFEAGGGEEAAASEKCQFYQRAWKSVCPEEWATEWAELREKGLWMGKY